MQVGIPTGLPGQCGANAGGLLKKSEGRDSECPGPHFSAACGLLLLELDDLDGEAG